MLILRQIKESVRTSTVHNATVIANGLMHMGTTTDDFLRENLEWVSKAVNWNKFNAVASLGLMHRVYTFDYLLLLSAVSFVIATCNKHSNLNDSS